MGTRRELRLRKETLVDLTDEELAFRGGNQQIVTEVTCRQVYQMVAVLRDALSLDATCITCWC